jgi:hypothetical protein
MKLLRHALPFFLLVLHHPPPSPHYSVHGYKAERAAVPKNLFVNPDAVWNNALKYFKGGAPIIAG